MDDKEKRKEHNEEILRKMQSGESFASINTMESWFPQRPIIKKDKNALNFIHKKDDNKTKENEE